MNNYIEKLNWRYATKLFDKGKKLSDEQRALLNETLSLTPSSFGLQPYKFIDVQDQNMKEKLQEAAWNQTQVTTCSDFYVICARTDIDQDYVKKYVDLVAETRKIDRDTLSDYEQMMNGFIQGADDEQQVEWASKQAYIALGFLMDAAAQNDIDTCPMEGFDKNKFDEILELEKKDLKSVVACAVGFRSEEDKYQQLAKVRKPQDEIIVSI